MRGNTLEDLETKREFRYALMRLARVPGHVVFYAGLALVCFGILAGLTVLPDALVELFTWGKYDGPVHGFVHPKLGLYPQLLLAGVAAAVGFWLVALGPAMYMPYMIMTSMPSCYTRVCHKCAKPLPPNWIIHRCPECGEWFPIGLKGYFVRLMSKAVTAINWAMLLLGVAFFMR